MTPERRMQILKDSQVLKVQRDPNWASDIETSVKNELLSILKAWDNAAATENIGPQEARAYFNGLIIEIYNTKIKSLEQVGSDS